MSFEEFKSFITEYYPEDCYDDDVIRSFYDKGFYCWELDKVLKTLDELIDKVEKKPIIQILLIKLNFLSCRTGGS